jgi:hypothetical protein
MFAQTLRSGRLERSYHSVQLVLRTMRETEEFPGPDLRLVLEDAVV